MKLKICSDLHVEFGFDYRLIKNRGEDVLVLAGDIGVGARMTCKLLNHFATVFPHVVYVFGNHEFYNGDIDLVTAQIKEGVADNVHVLDRTTAVIDGVTFVGAALWSNFNNRDTFIMQYCSRGITDFRVIKKGNKNFGTADAADLFDKDWGYIKTVVKQTPAPVVVVTHFMPSWACIAPKFRGETVLNHYFATELGNDIADMDNVNCWIYGHTHEKSDIMIGNTRVMCNPYGYHNRENFIDDEFDPVLNTVIEVNV